MYVFGSKCKPYIRARRNCHGEKYDDKAQGTEAQQNTNPYVLHMKERFKKEKLT